MVKLRRQFFLVVPSHKEVRLVAACVRTFPVKIQALWHILPAEEHLASLLPDFHKSHKTVFSQKRFKLHFYAGGSICAGRKQLEGIPPEGGGSWLGVLLDPPDPWLEIQVSSLMHNTICKCQLKCQRCVFLEKGVLATVLFLLTIPILDYCNVQGCLWKLSRKVNWSNM